MFRYSGLYAVLCALAYTDVPVLPPRDRREPLRLHRAPIATNSPRLTRAQLKRHYRPARGGHHG